MSASDGCSMNLSVTRFGIDFRNPLVLTAGILGLSYSTMVRAYENGAGAVTSKSISFSPWPGHRNPTVIEYDAGLMNAVGLSNPGIENFVDDIGEVKKRGIPMILSVVGGCDEEMAEVAKRGEEAGVDFIELNVSCPNVVHKKMYHSSPDLLEGLVKTVKSRTSIPLFVKLSPNVDDLKKIAASVERAGADGITAINTVGPGMVIDLQSRRPVMNFGTGGLSGPAIRPVSVRCVYDIYEVVDIPIIGVGGVGCGKDVIEMMMAGASLVGLGSAIHYRGIGVFRSIFDELAEWMAINGYNRIEEVVGVAH